MTDTIKFHDADGREFDTGILISDYNLDPDFEDWQAEQADAIRQQEEAIAAEKRGEGWDWEAAWGQQPFDEHCRARMRHIDPMPLHRQYGIN